MQMILSHDSLTAKLKQMNAVMITRIYLGIAKVCYMFSSRWLVLPKK
mgnify:CR=1 FL=1